LGSGIELKEAAQFSFPNIVNPGSEGMIPSGDREVILELILLLIRLLRYVDVCSETDVGGKGNRRDLLIGINQVVPILVADGSGVNYCVAERRIESDVAKLQPVLCKVALGQIVSVPRLIIHSKIVLVIVANEQVVPGVESVIDTHTYSSVVIWQRNDLRRYRSGKCATRTNWARERRH